jgi:hypothetical protein
MRRVIDPTRAVRLRELVAVFGTLGIIGGCGTCRDVAAVRRDRDRLTHA